MFSKKCTINNLMKDLGVNEKTKSNVKKDDDLNLTKNENHVKVNSIKNQQKQTNKDMKKLKKRKNNVLKLASKFSEIIDKNKPKKENIDNK